MKAHDQATVTAFQRALRAIRNAKRTASAKGYTGGRLGLQECCVCGELKGYAMLSNVDTIAAPISHGYCEKHQAEALAAVKAFKVN